MRFIDKILLLFLVTAGIQRVDLFAGKSSFLMQPSLVIALFLIPYTFILLSIKRQFKVHLNVVYFIIFQLLICAWFLFSIIDLKDLLQVKRIILFFIITTSTSCFLILYYHSSFQKIILVKFIKYSFYIYVFFSFIQLYLFLKGTFGGNFVEPIGIMILNPPTIGTYFPRLTGGLYDPNIGGYFLAFLFILNRQFKANIKYNKYITLLIFLTLSRSAIMAFILILVIDKIIFFILNKPRIIIQRKMNKKVFVAFFSSLYFFIIGIFYVIFYTNLASNFVKGVQARLFNEDNSTSIHAGLFKIAINGIFHDPWHFIKGYGFSSSFLYTQEFFPNSKYGNFHSELITIFFETGVIGFILYLLFLSLPLSALFAQQLRKNINYILIGISLFLQGIFYQQFLFQYYWIMISFIWLLPVLKFSEDNSLENEEI